jgi:Ca-activated chloride channel family protein
LNDDLSNLTWKGEIMANPLPTLPPAESPAANGVERGVGCLSTAHGNLPLKRLEVEARIDGLVASTIVRQTFVNAVGSAGHAAALEATYVFPLPDRAAVTRFEMRIGERLIDGVLRERGEARREYAAALEAGHRAAIAEEDRSGVFTLCVGNILPGEEARVTLEMTGPVACDDGEATFQFPLVVAPRYVPGIALPGHPVGDGTAWDTDAVPDASRITPPVLLPGFPNPVELRLAVDIHDSGLPLRDFRSSLHAVVEDEPAAGRRRITLQPGERLNRDFILRFNVGESSIRTALVTTPDADGSGGTLQLTIVPPAGLLAAGRPRDVVFVLDRSGSMEGWKMVTARRALGRMIDSLGSADRFAVLAFDDRVETPPGMPAGRLLPATDRQRFTAIEFLGRIESRGGTEIAAPLGVALGTLRTDAHDERERIVAIVTDGQVTNEDQVLRQLGPRLAGVRVCTLGIDRAVNAGFLRKLAVLGGGYTEVVESEDRLDAVLDRIHRRIATPVLTDVRVEFPECEVDPDSQTPRRIADLFAGTPLVIRSRYRGAAPTTARISATDGAMQPWTASVTATHDAAAAIRALWAREQVRALEDEYAMGKGEPQTLAARIVDCSLRFGILSRFTAYVAVDRSEVVNAGGECRRILQPLDAPDGWDMIGEEDESAAIYLACAGPARCADRGDSVDSLIANFGERAYRLPSASAGGILKKLRSGVRAAVTAVSSVNAPQQTTAEVAGARFDLAAYRDRADKLLGDARKSLAAGNAAASITLLVAPLAALVEDLVSVGAPESEIQPLRELLESARKLLASGGDNSQAAALWQQAETILEAFARGNPSGGSALASAAAPERKEFWK